MGNIISAYNFFFNSSFPTLDEKLHKLQRHSTNANLLGGASRYALTTGHCYTGIVYLWTTSPIANNPNPTYQSIIAQLKSNHASAKRSLKELEEATNQLKHSLDLNLDKYDLTPDEISVNTANYCAMINLMMARIIMLVVPFEKKPIPATIYNEASAQLALITRQNPDSYLESLDEASKQLEKLTTGSEHAFADDMKQLIETWKENIKLARKTLISAAEAENESSVSYQRN